MPCIQRVANQNVDFCTLSEKAKKAHDYPSCASFHLFSVAKIIHFLRSAIFSGGYFRFEKDTIGRFCLHSGGVRVPRAPSDGGIVARHAAVGRCGFGPSPRIFRMRRGRPLSSGCEMQYRTGAADASGTIRESERREVRSARRRLKPRRDVLRSCGRNRRCVLTSPLPFLTDGMPDSAVLRFGRPPPPSM